MSRTPWYAEGLRFRCTGCGACCTGEPGRVWVNDDEVTALATLLGIDEAELERDYLRRVGDRRSLVEHDDGDCVFFDPDSRRCRVYPARPVQCRTWPFWRENLRDRAAWEATESECPGAGKGAIVPLDTIRAHLRAHRAARRRDGSRRR